jgi:hypothetical protein
MLVSAYGFADPLLARGVVCVSVETRRCASRSSRASRRVGASRCPSGPSTELRLLQSMTVVGGRACSVACRATPLMRFQAPAALSSESSPPAATIARRAPPGLPHPVRSVLRVSHPPDGFLLDKPARPCSMPERSWSSSPYRAFSSSGAVSPLGVRCLPALHRVHAARRTIALGSAGPAGCRRRTAAACGFKALLPGASSSRHPRLVKGSERSMLSWVSGPFRAFPRRPSANVSPRGSSLELSIRASAASDWPKPDQDGATLHRLPGVFTRPGLVVLSSARQALVGFPTSSIASPIREPPRPGSWFHLGRRTTSPLRGQSLFGRF